jgi:hypothetical protein
MTQEDRCDDGDVDLLAWFEKTRMNNPEVAIRGRTLEAASRFAKEVAHSEDSISAVWTD